MSLDRRVPASLGRHPAVRSVRLVGSRGEGRATALSDWDFLVETDDFPAVARDLPALCAPLGPIAAQWDRLSPHYTWMLMLRGPTKVDIIFADQAHEVEPPWKPTAENVAAIDRHFWDWTLWLSGKVAAGKLARADDELELLFEHLLAPLGVVRRPESVGAAVDAYRDARAAAERRLRVKVPRDLEDEVAPSLTAGAFTPA